MIPAKLLTATTSTVCSPVGTVFAPAGKSRVIDPSGPRPKPTQRTVDSS